MDTTKLVPLLPRQDLPAAIAGQLIRLIMDGQYNPGERLPTEYELCERFGASRGTIREAVKALSLVGMVHVERGKGTVVADRSDFLVRPISLGFNTQADLEAIIEARKLIETELAGLAAERAGLAEIERMKTCLDNIAYHENLERTDTYFKFDIEFHLSIAQAARSPLLSQFLTLSRNLLEEWFRVPCDVELSRDTFDYHRRVFEAIRGRKPDEARKVMSELVEFSGELLRAYKRNQLALKLATSK